MEVITKIRLGYNKKNILNEEASKGNIQNVSYIFDLIGIENMIDDDLDMIYFDSCSSGSIELTKWCLDKFGDKLDESTISTIDYGFQSGSKEMIEFLLNYINKQKMKVEIYEGTKDILFENNTIDFVEWCLTKFPQLNKEIKKKSLDIFCDILICSSKDLIEWFYIKYKPNFNIDKQHLEISYKMMKNICRNGSIELFEWFNINCFYFDISKCMFIFENSLESKNIEFVKYILNKYNLIEFTINNDGNEQEYSDMMNNIDKNVKSKENKHYCIEKLRMTNDLNYYGSLYRDYNILLTKFNGRYDINETILQYIIEKFPKLIEKCGIINMFKNICCHYSLDLIKWFSTKYPECLNDIHKNDDELLKQILSFCSNYNYITHKRIEVLIHFLPEIGDIHKYSNIIIPNEVENVIINEKQLINVAV